MPGISAASVTQSSPAGLLTTSGMRPNRNEGKTIEYATRAQHDSTENMFGKTVTTVFCDVGRIRSSPRAAGTVGMCVSETCDTRAEHAY